MHRELPEAFFRRCGARRPFPNSVGTGIVAYSLVAVFNVGVQANGMTAPASAKGTTTSRTIRRRHAACS